MSESQSSDQLSAQVDDLNMNVELTPAVLDKKSIAAKSSPPRKSVKKKTPAKKDNLIEPMDSNFAISK